MIIMTIKRPRLTFATGVTLLSALCCCSLVFGLVHQPYEAALSTPASFTLKNGNDRLDYIQNWGWEVEETPLSTQVLLIPNLLDSSYSSYISLQTSQGFPPLTDYCGEEVIQYTYRITNYPSEEEGIQLNLLCHENQVIAGEVLSPEIGGFIHSLAKPQ